MFIVMKIETLETRAEESEGLQSHHVGLPLLWSVLCVYLLRH